MTGSPFVISSNQMHDNHGLTLRLIKALKRHAKKDLTYIAGKRAEADRLYGAVVRHRPRAISFDLFDTLVDRYVNNPQSLFMMVAEKAADLCPWPAEDFALRRAGAERRLTAEAGRGEITLAEIYDVVFSEDSERSRLFQQMEIETEVKVSVVNPPMLELVQRLSDAGCRLVLVSDMYLPQASIERILGKHGMHYFERVYVSSSIGATKRKGGIFPLVRKDLAIASHEICHIGNDFRSDYWMPRKAGWVPILVNRYSQSSSLLTPLRSPRHEAEALERFLGSRSSCTKGMYWSLGYEALGPLLLSFSWWLKQSSNQSKMLFLMREGALLRKAFLSVYPDAEGRTVLLYASRRALAACNLAEAKTLAELSLVAGAVGEEPVLSVRDLVELGFLNECDARSFLESAGLSFEDPLTPGCDTIENAYRVFLYPILARYGSTQREFFLEYLNELLRSDTDGNQVDLAVIDVGWRGSMQDALRLILGESVPIEGYYLGICPRESYADMAGKHGALFEDAFGARSDEYYEITLTIMLFELMFLSTEGSTTGYGRGDDGHVAPIQGIPESDGNQARTVAQIQEAALAFVEDYLSEGLGDSHATRFTVADAFEHYRSFAIRPSRATLNALGGLKSQNVNDSFELVSSHDLAYWVLHPTLFLKHFKACHCKSIWLQSIVGFCCFTPMKLAKARMVRIQEQRSVRQDGRID